MANKSLKGTANSGRKFSVKKVGNDLKGPGMTILGILGGALLDKLALSKIDALQVKEEKKFSKYMKPVLITIAGAVGRNFVPASIKPIVDGITVYGGVKTINAATSKDVMTGLGSLEPYRELHNTPPTPELYVLNRAMSESGYVADSM